MAGSVEITSKDRRYVRKVVEVFAGKSVAGSITTVNEDVVYVVGKLVAASLECSECPFSAGKINLVPKPEPAWPRLKVVF